MNILAIGASHNDDNGEYSGHVRIFQNTNGSWNRASNGSSWLILPGTL